MMNSKTISLAMIAATCVFFVVRSMKTDSTDLATTDAGALLVNARGREPIRPIPQSIELDEGKVSLGEKLFHETMLSKDNTVSCASCHDLEKGGTDRRARSLGLNDAEGNINAPTVFNSGLHFKLFWDGRAETLEDQVSVPLLAKAEMGGQLV